MVPGALFNKGSVAAVQCGGVIGQRSRREIGMWLPEMLLFAVDGDATSRRAENKRLWRAYP